MRATQPAICPLHDAFPPGGPVCILLRCNGLRQIGFVSQYLPLGGPSSPRSWAAPALLGDCSRGVPPRRRPRGPVRTLEDTRETTGTLHEYSRPVRLCQAGIFHERGISWVDADPPSGRSSGRLRALACLGQRVRKGLMRTLPLPHVPAPGGPAYRALVRPVSSPDEAVQPQYQVA